MTINMTAMTGPFWAFTQCTVTYHTSVRESWVTTPVGAEKVTLLLVISYPWISQN